MSIHPRPNPIIAAIYMLRDIGVDAVVIHGPAGCGFMVSRMIEDTGIRVVTSAMDENDLIFGASEKLVAVLKEVERMFCPRTVAVIGTCSSMIIGEDMETSIKRSGVRYKTIFVDCHGCMGDNTAGAIRAVDASAKAGMISIGEADRQKYLLSMATKMEKERGTASVDYLPPSNGPTKIGVAKKIIDCLTDNGRLAVVSVSKKELAYRFADVFLAVDEANRKLGGKTRYIANLDPQKGLPKIRGYASDILSELTDKGISVDIAGGLDEYAVIGNVLKEKVDGFRPDLLVIAGIPHAYPHLEKKGQILITDQPRQLSNYLSKGYDAVGEISSHAMVMNVRNIVHTETGDTIRELLKEIA
ncbi:light-independent protochlorophyllide reductase subunit B [Candidatus Methanoplasma termitum]|uniref:BchB2 protein n=1 Tax=Candidatus Methanoplasma termitum TaxID=1577791 RepID=A0A0A7LCH2_9ARCH|nr:Ni-sirohydrochlorin a,c-diamide reductive cyclase catalytic subunit [Candidatus Methanoplasma termitum]AIZ56683.1 light-independent protochlorophyllide reductase subunit B [Candidatus Methanoplasma termitum]MCL2333327.1 Ni-sirohydrochlorin a,c-diamide reductive cyclase catalytic subunit [Candidatus Methanoplasma sp.]